jgi:hypothetical protein
MNKNYQSFIHCPHITKEGIFHGYVLGYIIGIRWTLAPTGGMGNPKLYDVVKRYLTFACGDQEWFKRQVLDVIRDNTRSDIRKGVKQVLPGLFFERRQRPLQVPPELEDSNIAFDIDFINQLRDEVSLIKQEYTAMNTEETAVDNVTTTDEVIPATPVVKMPVPARDSNAARAESFELPTGIQISELTLDNFREKTGKRFRMTKDQRERNKAKLMTREEAFEEFKVALLELNGSN